MADAERGPEALAAEVAGLARTTGRTIAVAESLTGGMVCASLAAAEAAAQWFRGGIVAYSTEVKHEVLGVPDGPVVSPQAARAMAAGARAVLGADIAVSTTGSGGPQPQDGQPPGTVYLVVDDGTEAGAEPVLRRLDGGPGAVCAAATVAALELLAERLRLPAVESTGSIGSA